MRLRSSWLSPPERSIPSWFKRLWISVVDRSTPRLFSRLCNPAMLVTPPPPPAKAAQELAEQARAGQCVDRDHHGIGVGLAVQVDDETKQVEVQRPQDQVEHLAGFWLRLRGARGQRVGRRKHTQWPSVEAVVQGTRHAGGPRKGDLRVEERAEQVAEDAPVESVDVETDVRGGDLHAEQLEVERREPEGDDVAPCTGTLGRDREPHRRAVARHVAARAQPAGECAVRDDAACCRAESADVRPNRELGRSPAVARRTWVCVRGQCGNRGYRES